MAKHGTSDTAHMGSTAYCPSHTLTAQGRKTLHACGVTQRLHSGTEWTRKGCRLCSNKRVRCTLIPRAGYGWLVSVTVWPGQEVKLTRLTTRWSAAGPEARKLARWGAFPTREGREFTFPWLYLAPLRVMSLPHILCLMWRELLLTGLINMEMQTVF